jgi:hypothetical protein
MAPHPPEGRGVVALAHERLERITLESLRAEEKGDWLVALDEQSAPRIPLAGRVPVPFFRPHHECDPL